MSSRADSRSGLTLVGVWELSTDCCPRDIRAAPCRRRLSSPAEEDMLDLVIRGGLVVTSYDALIGDVGIQDDKIVAVASPGSLPVESARVLDATGTIVLPGGIEPHAHIAIPVPEHWAGRPEVMSQPPEAASRAAAFGGVTTIIDFAGNLNPPPGDIPLPQSIPQEIDSRRTVFRGHAYTDFAFHYILAGRVAV